VEYAVCGGLAVAIHGYPRATKDMDFLVQSESAEKVEFLARKAGYTLSAGIIPFDSGKPTERRVLRLSKARGEDLLTLDLVLVGPVLEEVWAGRERRRIGDQELSVVSRRGLIHMKELASRPVDLADIRELSREDTK
jgi:hypothetical protein